MSARLRTTPENKGGAQWGEWFVTRPWSVGLVVVGGSLVAGTLSSPAPGGRSLLAWLAVGVGMFAVGAIVFGLRWLSAGPRRLAVYIARALFVPIFAAVLVDGAVWGWTRVHLVTGAVLVVVGLAITVRGTRYRRVMLRERWRKHRVSRGIDAMRPHERALFAAGVLEGPRLRRRLATHGIYDMTTDVIVTELRDRSATAVDRSVALPVELVEILDGPA